MKTNIRVANAEVTALKYIARDASYCDANEMSIKSLTLARAQFCSNTRAGRIINVNQDTFESHGFLLCNSMVLGLALVDCSTQFRIPLRQ